MHPSTETNPGTPPKRKRRRLLRGCAWGCGGVLALSLVLIAILFGLLSRVPKSYLVATSAVPPPEPGGSLGGGLDGFDSPYVGHTGSWDGKGVRVLPRPWPMLFAAEDVRVPRGTVLAFRHVDGADLRAGQVWIVWSTADTGDATVRIPVRRPEVEVISVTGGSSRLRARDGWVQIELPGDPKMAPGVLVVDRPGEDAP